MIIPTKKLQNGFEMPVYGIGTWEMGGKMERDPRNDDQADITAIKSAIEMGVTHIDTAEAYAAGHSETLVGKAIQGYNRKDLFLVSKVKEPNLNYDQIPQSLQHSLERMQTDYLDVYMIHGPSETIPIEESMKALCELKDKGLIKHIAVSNFTVERFQAAQTASSHPIVAGQYHLNLKYREAEKRGILDHFQKNDVMFIAWRPLQKGLFNKESSALLQEMMQKYHKTASQIALNWLVSQQNVVTLSKTRSIDHLKENIAAVDFTMEKEDVIKLDQEYPDQEAVSDAVPLI
ncbi:MAG: aldo/keto reductase [Weeksellaceae bacterium]